MEAPQINLSPTRGTITIGFLEDNLWLGMSYESFHKMCKKFADDGLNSQVCVFAEKPTQLTDVVEEK